MKEVWHNGVIEVVNGVQVRRYDHIFDGEVIGYHYEDQDGERLEWDENNNLVKEA